MKYFLIAGEASGDMHAARLIGSIRQHDADAVFVGLGGDKMQAAGCRLYQHYSKMAYMGYVAVLAHIGDIRRNVRIARQALRSEQPDELILIDYPGFNLRMAAFCREHLPHTRVTYYIPPKIWAWKRWRVHKIGRYCHRILGIFPFEPDFYGHYGYPCTYVGNPTAEAIADYKQSAISGQQTEARDRKSDINCQLPTVNYIALLPGSRKHEITNCLPKMLQGAVMAMQSAPDVSRIVVTTAPGIDPAFYEPFIRNYPMAELSSDTYQVVSHARAAVVNSGTATLETALLGCPQLAVYHLAGGILLDFMRMIVLRIPHFTLVNILAGRELIVEMLGRHFTPQAVACELRRLLCEPDHVARVQQGYDEIRSLLGTHRAAETAAAIIADTTSNH